MVRAIFWVLILAILYKYPLIQITLLTALSGSMLGLIIKKKPFAKLITFIEFTTYEIIIFFVHLSILILGVMDQMGYVETSTREKIGVAIIFGFTIFGIIALAFMVISFCLGLMNGIKSVKKMRAVGSLNFVLLITIPFASYGMDFEEIENDEEQVKQVIPVSKLSRKKIFQDEPAKPSGDPVSTLRDNESPRDIETHVLTRVRSQFYPKSGDKRGTILDSLKRRKKLITQVMDISSSSAVQPSVLYERSAI